MKSKYQKELDEAGTPIDIANCLQMLKVRAIIGEDILAAKTFLDYYLLNPKNL
jgi:hypothetical protein